jgi:conjugal transfer pilus assembly protein TrbC
MSISCIGWSGEVLKTAPLSNSELILQKAPHVLTGEGCSLECTKSLTTEKGADLEAMADRFSSLRNLNMSKNKDNPQLFIMVSLSIPEQSLKLWSEQANKLGAILVLRGLVDNSIQKTTDKAQQLFGETEQGSFSIDPELFQTFGIEKVPAVVLVTKETSCNQESCGKPIFDVVYGDTPLVDALEQISRRGSIEGQKVAKELIKKYREHHE